MRAYFASVSAALVLFFGGLAFGQSVNLSQLNPSQINLSKVSLTNAGVYFQGPAEFYVTGIQYGNRVYSAILDYNGKGSFTVKVPNSLSVAGKPTAINLAKAKLSLTPSGALRVNGIDLGTPYTGTIKFSPENQDFEFASYSPEGAGSAAQTSGTYTVNLSQLNPAQIDMSKVNLKDAAVYFQGPMKLYVTGIGYGNQSYAAVLDYNGKGGFTVEVPNQVTTAGKPTYIDLSNIRLGLNSQGITVNGLDINGTAYSATLVYSQANNDLQVASYQPQSGAASGTVVADLQNQVASLKSQLSQAQSGTSNAAYLTAASRLATFTLSGFGSGSGKAGNWVQSGSELKQTNGSQLYAKYVMHADQSADQLLYTFTGDATGNGWRGFGLHFLGSGSTTSNGWGFGKSYLIWVTRDPAHLQTGATYVELYKSSSDSHMVEIASKQVTEPINTPMKVSVYVNKGNEMLDVMVDGKLTLSYTDPRFIANGNAVALRALGTDTFSKLRVLAP